jgi:cytidine deaminase
MPCGACRQWIAELAPRAVILVGGVQRDYSLDDLLPVPFQLR